MVFMSKSLKYLVLFGFAVWAILMFDQYHAVGMTDFILKLGESERCANVGEIIDGERVLTYGDRLRQFAKGCW